METKLLHCPAGRPVLVLCEACGSEGRRYSGHPNDPHPRDEGPCSECGGTGELLVPSEPAEEEWTDD
jgi:hypothetical protein